MIAFLHIFLPCRMSYLTFANVGSFSAVSSATISWSNIHWLCSVWFFDLNMVWRFSISIMLKFAKHRWEQQSSGSPWRFALVLSWLSFSLSLSLQVSSSTKVYSMSSSDIKLVTCKLFSITSSVSLLSLQVSNSYVLYSSSLQWLKPLFPIANPVKTIYGTTLRTIHYC